MDSDEIEKWLKEQLPHVLAVLNVDAVEKEHVPILARMVIGKLVERSRLLDA
jgi:hypothetical protein